MKVTYKGLPHPVPAKILQKLDAKFAKLSKLLDGRAGKGEREAHVVVVEERRRYRAEVTVHFYDHQLVGIGSDADLLNALLAALEKIDTQAVKLRGKWREKHRRKNGGIEVAANQAAVKEDETSPASDKPGSTRVFRVNGLGRRKPMTLDEALLEMDQTRDYLVYRDTQRDGLSVLVRRRDGNFDLIES